MMNILSLFSFDFLSVECMFENPEYFTSIYLWSVLPLCLAVALVVAHVARSLSSPGNTATTATLTYRLLLLGYLFLPPVTLKQLQALDCVTLAEKRYLRVDTSIDCDSSEFHTFRAVNGLFISLYLAIPLTWFALLFAHRDRLNPAPVTGSDRKHSLFIRDNDVELLPLRFLFASYTPPFYFVEVFETYRRILFVGVLPLLSAESGRRAVLGMIMALVSLAFYRESEPFLRQSTNILASVAQYCVLGVFGAALVIDTGLDNGLDPFILGSVLLIGNLSVAGLVLSSSGQRYWQERRTRHSLKARQAQNIEWACGFSEEKFATTLDQVERAHVVPDHALVFWYGTLAEVEAMLKQGVPAQKSPVNPGGILVTLSRPHELDVADRAVFCIREAVLALSFPRVLLQPLQDSTKQRKPTHGTSSASSSASSSSSPRLFLFPVDALLALRSAYFQELADATLWFQGDLLLPPRQIVRAYRLVDNVEMEEGREQKDAFAIASSEENLKDLDFQGSQSSTLQVGSVPPLQGETRTRHSVQTPESCLQLVESLAEIRRQCRSQGLELVYHYTQKSLAPLIYDTGFRMSTQGQGDGGVYFSTLGPASYHIGSPQYEQNIIIDCFGIERLEEYRGKGMLDLCLVYALEPSVVTPAPGGRDNAVMVSKATFHALALPREEDGNYFLRSDRLIGAFLLRTPNPAFPLKGALEAASRLDEERLQDAATKGRLADRQRAMTGHAEAVQLLHTSLHGGNSLLSAPGSGGSDSHGDSIAPENVDNSGGDLEMAPIEGTPSPLLSYSSSPPGGSEEIPGNGSFL
jgi:hypothetical protein